MSAIKPVHFKQFKLVWHRLNVNNKACPKILAKINAIVINEIFFPSQANAKAWLRKVSSYGELDYARGTAGARTTPHSQVYLHLFTIDYERGTAGARTTPYIQV